MQINKNLTIFIIIIAILQGCSIKKDESYNKPASYWYNQMLNKISINQLDDADNIYTSLQTEHRKSPLLASATLILANAHVNDEEYEVATFYYDQFLQKFDNNNLKSYVLYLKIRAKFLAFKEQFRDQKLINETLNEIYNYEKEFSDSSYRYLVNNIKSRLLMSKSTLDQEISNLYAKKNKPDAAKYYEKKAKKSWEYFNVIKDVSIPWYRAIFE